MPAVLIVLGAVLFALAGVLLFIGVRHFKEKGFLFNDAFLFASREERQAPNKKPYYRQSAIVFFFLSAMFFVLGLTFLVHNYKLGLLEIPLIAGALLFTVLSSLRINKQEEK